MNDLSIQLVVWDREGRAVPGLLPALGIADLLGRRASAPDRVGGVVLSAVGAGGKTTLLHAIGRECVALGLKTVLTTTTRLWHEDGAALDVDDALARRLDSALLVAGRPCKGGKIAAFPQEGFDRLRHGFDVILVEADGSRGMPFKVPAAHEPVVPPQTDLLLVVASATALGRPLGEVCFREEEARAILSADPTAGVVIDSAAAAALLRSGYVVPVRGLERSGDITVVITHVDHGASDDNLEGLIRLLPHHRVACVGTRHREANSEEENNAGRRKASPLSPAGQGGR
ncbi:selenium cofactor biosynthesis protein YqeC [Austwickia chelonae]|uniref:selenium cofactor biosynthesis protein YqeC n=1 Tax=Austwickia chelonae TaxID=100225 RepID=UPI000E255D87|nr:selenium cofactor biosynthesis protein YqeC [Austwickia chelonae]